MFRLENTSLLCNTKPGVIMLIIIATILLLGLGLVLFVEYKMSVLECKGFVYMAVLYVVVVAEALIGSCQ